MPQWLQDEDLWAKAKQIAVSENRENDYAYITGIYKKSGGRIAHKKKNLKKAMVQINGKTKEVWFV